MLHYLLRGYRILGTNVWAGGYELDVVARRGRTLVFCEVKSRSRDGYGGAVAAVTPEKQRRVRRAAEAWLVAHPACRGLAVRFDVVSELEGRLRRIPSAF